MTSSAGARAGRAAGRTPGRRVARLGNLLGTLLLLGVTGACLAWIMPTFLGYERYVITGGSMGGSIAKGSVVLAAPVPVAELEVGDVITYLPPADSGMHDLVTHRIVATGAGQGGERVFRTQGDANPDPDPWRFTLRAGAQPVVRHSVPHVGHVLVALADARVRTVVIGLPAALVALVALRDLVGALRDPRPGSLTGRRSGSRAHRQERGRPARPERVAGRPELA